MIEDDPTELIESPTDRTQAAGLPDAWKRSMPWSLAIDMSKPLAHRDRAMLETLYSCGLRVSELCDLRRSWLHFDEGFIRVVGKGDKERLVPIGPEAMRQIETYIEQERVHLPDRDQSRGYGVPERTRRSHFPACRSSIW